MSDCHLVEGTRSGGIGLFPLALLTSVVIMMPTKGPDGSMMPLTQAMMMPIVQAVMMPIIQAVMMSTPSTTPPSNPPQTTPCMPPPCKSGFVKIGNRCYSYVTMAASLTVANMNCIDSSINLWEQKTLAEYNAVISQFNIG